jgi:hypothetical protein
LKATFGVRLVRCDAVCLQRLPRAIPSASRGFIWKNAKNLLLILNIALHNEEHREGKTIASDRHHANDPDVRS